MQKEITYEEYKIALEEIERLQNYIDHLKKVTKSYIYQFESKQILKKNGTN